MVALLLAVADPADGVGHEAVDDAGQHRRLVEEAAGQVGHVHGGGGRDAGADGGRGRASQDKALVVNSINLHTGRKEIFYLTTHSTHFIYGYMAGTRNSSMGQLIRRPIAP